MFIADQFIVLIGPCAIVTLPPAEFVQGAPRSPRAPPAAPRRREPGDAAPATKGRGKRPPLRGRYGEKMNINGSVRPGRIALMRDATTLPAHHAFTIIHPR